jgi:dihydrofolate reductase
VVLTRRPGWDAPGAVAATSLDDALGDAPGPVWVIGGASVYRAALPLADAVVVTELEQEFAGDTYAPDLGRDWRAVAREPGHGWAESRTGLRYRVVRYLPAPDLVRSHQFGRSR